MSQDRGPKGLDYTAHGVEGHQPLVFLLDHADRVDDRGDKHPQLDKKGYHISDVPILDIEGGQPQTDTNGAEESQSDQKGKEQKCDTWDALIVDHQGAQDEHGDEKVEQTGQGCRGRDNQSRKIYLGDKIGAAYQAVPGGGYCIGKIGPREQTGIDKNGVGDTIRRDLGQSSEKEGEHNHRKQRLNDCP